MICPHCSCTKFKPFVDDYDACTNCGHLIANDVVAIPMRPEPARKPAHSFQETKTVTYEVCEKYKDSIIDQRKSRTSWETIASLLHVVTGKRLCAKTVAKYALKIIGYDPFPAAKVAKVEKVAKPEKSFADKCRVITKQERAINAVNKSSQP